MNIDCFLNTLVIALNKYDGLRSKSFEGFNTFGKNMETKITGEEIIKLHNEDKFFGVGRNYGLYGDKPKNDKEIRNWKTFKYEVNFSAKRTTKQELVCLK